jgi:hypothetical protein
MADPDDGCNVATALIPSVVSAAPSHHPDAGLASSPPSLALVANALDASHRLLHCCLVRHQESNACMSAWHACECRMFPQLRRCHRS